MSAFDRLRAARALAPHEDSITRWTPFVQIDAADRDEIVTIHERLRARNAELLDERNYLAVEVGHARAEIETLEAEIKMQQKLLRLAREGDPMWREDQLVPRTLPKGIT